MHNYKRATLIAFLLVATLAGVLMYSASKAQAADPVNNTDRSLYVAVLDPVRVNGHDAIRVTLSDGWSATINPCRFEDGRRCYWLAHERGNRIGRSFVVVRGLRFYLNMRGL